MESMLFSLGSPLKYRWINVLTELLNLLKLKCTSLSEQCCSGISIRGDLKETAESVFLLFAIEKLLISNFMVLSVRLNKLWLSKPDWPKENNIGRQNSNKTTKCLQPFISHNWMPETILRYVFTSCLIVNGWKPLRFSTVYNFIYGFFIFNSVKTCSNSFISYFLSLK